MIADLTGRRILVAGATGGIGRAVAGAVQASGAQVLGSYRTDRKGAETLEGQGIRMVQADLTDRAQARDLVKRALADGPLDGLVYAAGNTRDKTLLKMTDADWDEVLALHLTGLFVCFQAALPHMKERRAGRLIAFGSYGGATGRIGQANYAAAKAGTVGFVKTVAREMGRFGVTANVILPGFIDSKMTRAVPEAGWERARADSALGEVGSAESAAAFTAWLLSDAGRSVTGQVLSIDSRIL
ncbi:MAG: beta-ketoacyl-ACP reductase [Candidatus Omnitrophica bacterium CG11_big_fil_rev_8_21_14_0_20_64_10]|nr:MAG: beta-ketoacyl-ACP reductase [Candidatus Omnitrophica bacterium CG11_big_fil_rev_8_21_14_0_20_64_10]